MAGGPVRGEPVAFTDLVSVVSVARAVGDIDWCFDFGRATLPVPVPVPVPDSERGCECAGADRDGAGTGTQPCPEFSAEHDGGGCTTRSGHNHPRREPWGLGGSPRRMGDGRGRYGLPRRSVGGVGWPFVASAVVDAVTGKTTVEFTGVYEYIKIWVSSPQSFGYVEAFDRSPVHFQVRGFNAAGEGPASVVVCGSPVGKPEC